MVSFKNIYDFIDSIAPFSAQGENDNGGFLVGDGKRYAHHIGVVLDITLQTLSLARHLGVDLIVSHHPVIFEPRKSFTAGDIAFELANSGIAAICAHTSLDCAEGGVNDVLSELLGVMKPEPFPTAEFPAGMVRVGFLQKSGADELAEYVGGRLCAEVRYCDGGKAIETVAVCGGGGGSCLQEIIEADIDAYITGDVSHHHFLSAADNGLTLIAAGHFETENPIVQVLADKIKANFPDLEVTVLEQEIPVDVYVPELLR